MNYCITTVETKDIDLDFQKLYNYISEEDRTNDPNFITEDFCDNTLYYLWNVLRIYIKPSDIIEIDEGNKNVLDKMCSDFKEWVITNKLK